MNQDTNSLKGKKVSPPGQPTQTTEVTKRPPLFRRIDWLTLIATTFFVFLGYFLTIAPDMTLEDSGELAVGSFYAGVPHPPGYPVWTMYTWFFTKILPWGNVAWRVGIASAFAGALGCGFLAMMVSRGSSMMIEGIEGLKNIERRSENLICIVSGVVAGMLMGFNGYMWSQSVIVEVYSLSVLSLMGMCCLLLRWVYEPERMRYLYIALFLFGITITNHMSLLVAAMGIEVLICAANPRLGRDCFIVNAFCYIAGLLLKAKGAGTPFDNNAPLFMLFNLIGIGSIITAGVLFVKTVDPRATFFGWFRNFLRVIVLAVMFGAGAAFYLYMPVASMSNPPMNWGYPRTAEGFMHAVKRGQYESVKPTSNPADYVRQIGMYVAGAEEEFGAPFLLLAILPWLFFKKMQKREKAWMIGTLGIFLCLSFLLLELLNPGPDKQSRDLNRVFMTASHTMLSIWVGYGLTLIAAFFVTQYQAARKWAIWGAVAGVAGALYSMAVIVRKTYSDLSDNMGGVKLFFYGIGQSLTQGQNVLEIVSYVFLLGLTLAFLLLVLVFRKRINLFLLLCLFALIPGFSILAHWFENEQRDHMFGYWFGHDMFTPPFMAPDGKLSYDAKLRAELLKDPKTAKAIYPEMARDAMVFGGTDPGRFCPTYMIFCEGFIPGKCKPKDPVFDRRDSYLITQNALADGTYLNYIRAHYMRSAENDPPFFQEFFGHKAVPVALAVLIPLLLLAFLWGRVHPGAILGIALVLDIAVVALHRPALSFLDTTFTNLGDNIEKERRAGTSFFKNEDFTDLAGFAAKLNKHSEPVSQFIFENLSKETQGKLGNPDDGLRRALVKDLNKFLERELALKKELKQKTAEKEELEARGKGSEKIAQLKKEIEQLTKMEWFYSPQRFQGVKLSDHVQRFAEQNPQSHTRIRLNRMLMEEYYGKAIAQSEGGVFPDLEIHTPSPEESQECFQEYLQDAQRRLQANQLKPGEDVHIEGGRVQVTGQIAVMSINGLLTKVIFDKTPKHEFYVEESFPLDWMYPHQEPFGIIMKINREPLKEMTQEICDRDHQFWSDYSTRFIGNWIKYETPIEEICKFGEKMYLRHDFRGFKGDPKFVRDDNAQKAFSKLRSSIGGVYMWRYNTVQNPVEKERMFKEAEFAFKQAFAFCPYSPEAVYRYVQLLNSRGRLPEAIKVVETCLKLDSENGQIQSLLQQLKSIQQQMGAPRTIDSQALFNEVNKRMEAKQTNEAINLLDQVVASPVSDPGTILEAARRYVAMGDTGRLEKALDRLVKIAPENPEAWYDLAGLQTILGKLGPALDSLTKAISLSTERLKREPTARDLIVEARKDPRFTMLRQMPEFKKLVPDAK
jgi:hypothetical protein